MFKAYVNWEGNGDDGFIASGEDLDKVIEAAAAVTSTTEDYSVSVYDMTDKGMFPVWSWFNPEYFGDGFDGEDAIQVILDQGFHPVNLEELKAAAGM